MLDPIEMKDFACLALHLAVDEDVSRSLGGMEVWCLCAYYHIIFWKKDPEVLHFLYFPINTL